MYIKLQEMSHKAHLGDITDKNSFESFVIMTSPMA